MSDEQNADLLNEHQMKQHMSRNQKSTKKQSKLKNWMVYWKRRGKNSNQVQKDYEKDMEEVGTFSTLNDFFGFYSSIKEPADLQIDTKIYYFLKDCKPTWQSWLHSGMLLIKIKFKGEDDEVGKRILNQTWDFLLFSLIGNNLPQPRVKQGNRVERDGSEPVIGLILQRRNKISLIEVWYRNEVHSSQLTHMIEHDIKEHLKLKQPQQKSIIQMRYRRHKDSIQTSSTLKGGVHLKTTLGTVSMYL